MRAFYRPALAAVLSVPAALSAGAAEYRQAFPEDIEACFIRRYDRTHLAANPAQSVAEIVIARDRAARRSTGPRRPHWPWP